jgi:hypothetical protein
MKAQLKLTESQIADYKDQVARLNVELKNLEVSAKLYALRCNDAVTAHEQRYWSERFISTKHAIYGKKIARKQYVMAINLSGA